MVHNRTLILYRCLATNLPGYNSLALNQGQLFNELGYLDVGGTDVRAASVPACNRESLWCFNEVLIWSIVVSLSYLMACSLCRLNCVPVHVSPSALGGALDKHQLLITKYHYTNVNCTPSNINCWLSNINCWPSNINCWLSNINCWLSDKHQLLTLRQTSTVDHQTSTTMWLLK